MIGSKPACLRSLPSQILICFLDIEPCQKQGDQKVKDHGHPQIHDMEHVDTRRGLLGCASHISAEGQKPARQGGTDSAAKLRSERCAGIHSAVNTLAVSQISVLGAGRDQSVHISLKRTHADGSDGGARQHERNRSYVARDHDAQTAEGTEGIASEIKPVHPSESCDKGGREQQADDHGNVYRPRDWHFSAHMSYSKCPY